jgi:ferredoxin
MPVRVIPEKCPQNHRCPAVSTCPTEALTQEGNKAPVVDDDKCTDCGACVKRCPMKALVLD